MSGIGKIAAIGAMSMGVDFGRRDSYTGEHHDPNKRVEYYDSGKPMSKRRKRRLRGKAPRTILENNNEG